MGDPDQNAFCWDCFNNRVTWTRYTLGAMRNDMSIDAVVARNAHHGSYRGGGTMGPQVNGYNVSHKKL